MEHTRGRHRPTDPGGAHRRGDPPVPGFDLGRGSRPAVLRAGGARPGVRGRHRAGLRNTSRGWPGHRQVHSAAASCRARGGITGLASERKAALLVVDSIQTVQTAAAVGSAGGVAQLRESTAELVRFAKSTATAVIIIGHVTKEGMIAGPRMLEHLVDTVLYFESEAGSRYRIVRATKNRFGAVNELGFFAMTE